uniref:Uncharacterized protein n=1 Tax=Panagrolaimus sp. ES5 TaxID=591445 RepID=A0AC34GK61_9BILA
VFKSIYKQDFPFHINYINYIIEHSSSTVQLKLFQTCKYFFSKTPFVPIEKLCRNSYSLEWKAVNGSHQEVLNLSNIKSKLWITNSVEYACLINVKGFYEGIETAIGKYEVTSLILSNHNIKLKAFKFLISSPKLIHLDMKMMRIQDEEDGDKIITFDRVIRELPKLDSFTLVFHIATDYTKIIEALKFCDIKNLKLGNIE